MGLRKEFYMEKALLVSDNVEVLLPSGAKLRGLVKGPETCTFEWETTGCMEEWATRIEICFMVEGIENKFETWPDHQEGYLEIRDTLSGFLTQKGWKKVFKYGSQNLPEPKWDEDEGEWVNCDDVQVDIVYATQVRLWKDDVLPGYLEMLEKLAKA